jgi:hypothetical protein
MQIQHRLRTGAGSGPERVKKDFPWEISARVQTVTRGHPQKKRYQVVARIRMTSASGFTWVAREPKLMVGAEGARILTEINRLPQFAPISTT